MPLTIETSNELIDVLEEWGDQLSHADCAGLFEEDIANEEPQP